MQILIDENNVVISAVIVGGIPDGIEVDNMPLDCAYSSTKYKYVDGAFIENPDYVLPDTLSPLKAAKIEESKTELAQWLAANPMTYTDGKQYSVTEEKQSLLNSNIASYERAKAMGIEYPLKWNSTGEECVEWSYTDLLVRKNLVINYFKKRRLRCGFIYTMDSSKWIKWKQWRNKRIS